MAVSKKAAKKNTPKRKTIKVMGQVLYEGKSNHLVDLENTKIPTGVGESIYVKKSPMQETEINDGPAVIMPKSVLEYMENIKHLIKSSDSKDVLIFMSEIIPFAKKSLEADIEQERIQSEIKQKFVAELKEKFVSIFNRP